jgi:uncharacterized membrane protein
MLPGMKALLNFHPLFVHFPIALWLSALLFEMLAVWRGRREWHETAVRLLYLGTCAGILAVATGLAAQSSVEPRQEIQAVLTVHKLLMLGTTSFALGLSLYVFAIRGRWTAGRQRLLLAGLIVLAVLLTLGADRGGFLVFHYGQAVNYTTSR